MFKLPMLFFILLMILPLTVIAETENVSTSEVNAPVDNPKTIDEADQVITNRRLRAANGSLSKLSGTVSLNYQGGSVEKPAAAQRPNIVSGADALTLQYLSANVGVKYRFSTLNSLTLGTGLFMTTPFQNSITTDDPQLRKEFDNTKQDVTVSDPNIAYSNISRLYGFQVVSTVTPTLITNSQQRQMGYRASFDFASTIMKDVGTTGLSLGGTFNYTKYAFDNSNQNLASSILAFYPVAEYIINDKLNLRTVFGWQVYQKTRGQSGFTKRIVYQSLGLGVTLSRNIFLYPNIQFIPSDMRADRTNIGLSAYINVF